MQRIYLDNAATSFPKAPGSGEAMLRYMQNGGGSPGRGGYDSEENAAAALLELRERLSALFHGPEPEYCVLTPGATFGINMVLKGFLRPGDRVVTSSMEHNAVMRPLEQLRRQGVTVDVVPCSTDGSLEPERLEDALRAPARLLVMTHASNVCGTLMPAREAGEICRRHGVPFVLDAAQTAGHMDVDFSACGLSALIVPGHKGLLGPAGTGAALLDPQFAAALEPLSTGGTGSRSDSFDYPPELPDRFEAGTLNVPGVFGLLAAIKFIEEYGIGRIEAREASLTSRFLHAVEGAECRSLGVPADAPRAPAISLDFARRDNAEICRRLENDYGVLTRCGLQCAPAAHKTLGSFPSGAVRFSPGWSTSDEEIDAAAAAVLELAEK